jgi:hypothetical protein
MVVRFVCAVRVPLCVRVSRVCPGSPRCLFTGKGGAKSGLHAYQLNLGSYILEDSSVLCGRIPQSYPDK